MNPMPVVLSTLAAGLVAQQDPVPPTLPAPPLAPFHGVFVADPCPDGTVWVRGDRYKLGLGAGVAFQPLFGPRAQRDYPVTFTLAEVRAAGKTIDQPAPSPWLVQDRRGERRSGAIVERWDFAPGGVQQSFVLERPLGDGDLDLRLRCATGMTRSGDGPGVSFVAPGLGEVHYSDAVAIDASGRRLELPVEVAGEQLSIRVPAAFLRSAQWPVVVDPWLHAVVVDGTVADHQDARVAYDEVNNVWLVVAEEVLSATDTDIVCWRYSNPSGPPVLLDTVYAHNTPDLTTNPDVGSVTAQQAFMVAWHNAATFPTYTGEFQVRRRTANSTTQGTIFASSQGIGADPSNRPVVGGARTGSLFLLVMFRRDAFGGTDISARCLHTTGVGFGTQLFGAIPAQSAARGDVSTRQDQNDPWVVVWEECGLRCASRTLYAKGLTNGLASGSLAAQPTLTLASGSVDEAPRIAGHGGRLLAVWQRFGANDTNIFGQALSAPGGIVTPVGSATDLTAGEPGGSPALAQQHPSVSFDGCRHVVGYDEVQGATTEPRAMTLHVDAAGVVGWHDGHVGLGIGPGSGHGLLDLTAATGGNLGLHFGVMQRPIANGDLVATVIDAYAAGTLTVVDQTGCGQPVEPGIQLTGTPALGRTFTVSLTNVVGVPFLLLGASSVSALPGCGSCMQGVQLPAAATIVGASVMLTAPCDPSFVGFRLAFQGIALGQAGGCPAPVFGAQFAVSDTLTVQVL